VTKELQKLEELLYCRQKSFSSFKSFLFNPKEAASTRNFFSEN
jgi:hypothetical protein